MPAARRSRRLARGRDGQSARRRSSVATHDPGEPSRAIEPDPAGRARLPRDAHGRSSARASAHGRSARPLAGSIGPVLALAGDEGTRPGGRHGEPAVPAHARHQQAPAADLRPADDLLPARHARGHGDPRGHGHRRRQERRRHRRAAGRRAALRARADVPLPARRPGHRARDRPRPRLHRRRRVLRRAGRQHPARRRARGHGAGLRGAAPGAPGRSCTRSRTRSGSASRSSTRRARSSAFEEKPAQPKSQPHPDRRLLPPARRVRRHRGPGAVGSRRVRDHRRAQPLHPRRRPVHRGLHRHVDGRRDGPEPPPRRRARRARRRRRLAVRRRSPGRGSPGDATPAGSRPGAHLLVTGGAGFIGSELVRRLLARDDGTRVTVLDLLTYAGNRANLAAVEADPAQAARLTFVRGDIADPDLVGPLVAEADAVVNVAAETHVDRSILDPEAFLRTGVIGVHVLLEAVRGRRHAPPPAIAQPAPGSSRSAPTRSTATSPTAGRVETDPLAPRSPYAAAKAASELLVRAYRDHVRHGHGRSPAGSNTYGPHQHPEKLIPLFVTNALAGEPLPMYGDGMQIRDWLHVWTTPRASSSSCAMASRARRTTSRRHGAAEPRGHRAACWPRPAATGRWCARCPTARATTAGTRWTGRSSTRSAGRPRCRSSDGLPETVAWYRDNAGLGRGGQGRRLGGLLRRAVREPAGQRVRRGRVAGRGRLTRAGRGHRRQRAPRPGAHRRARGGAVHRARWARSRGPGRSSTSTRSTEDARRPPHRPRPPRGRRSTPPPGRTSTAAPRDPDLALRRNGDATGDDRPGLRGRRRGPGRWCPPTRCSTGRGPTAPATGPTRRAQPAQRRTARRRRDGRAAGIARRTKARR